MGSPKQLLLIGGRPLLQWVVDAAEASSLDRVVVVTGHAAEEVRAAVTLGRATWAHNPEPERGTMSSLRAGVAVAGTTGGVMKLVCDQPEVSSEIIDQLMAAWDPAAHRAAVVEYRDGTGHPMLFASDALDRVLAQDGDRLLWSLLEADPDSVTDRGRSISTPRATSRRLRSVSATALRRRLPAHRRSRPGSPRRPRRRRSPAKTALHRRSGTSSAPRRSRGLLRRRNCHRSRSK